MSRPFRHIACCIDESPAADAAVARAVELRDLEEGRLSLVHVAPHALLVDYIDGTPVPSPADINVREREWLEARAADVPGATPVFLEGLPGPEICRWAEQADVDLLVAGAHGGGWPMAVLGSTTRRLVDHAPCSVLVIRGTADLGAAPGQAAAEAGG
jgi:nucleotide-binding universal stress UspA family protein